MFAIFYYCGKHGWRPGAERYSQEGVAKMLLRGTAKALMLADASPIRMEVRRI
jgi:hypothetical protein